MSYYDSLKNLPTEELLKRQDDEQYVEEYRLICKKIIEARKSGDEQEIYIDEKEVKKEINESEVDRKVPKSLDECRKMDKTTKLLLALSESVEKWGGIMLVFILLAGIVVAIINGIVSAETIDEMGYMSAGDIKSTTFSAGVFLSTLSTWVIYAVVEYWAYNIIALIVDGLASIVYSNRITANVSLYNAKK